MPAMPRYEDRPETRPEIRSTTVLCVRRDDAVAIAGDGQVTMNNAVAKADAIKVRRLDEFGAGGRGVLVGFAGAAADAFALMERFQRHLQDSPQNVKKAAVELAKQWRTDRALRRLESLLVVADAEVSLLVSGTGDVIEPSDGVIGIGSGGAFALSAARALIDVTDLDAESIARKAMEIAAGICIYTNDNVIIESLSAA